jgi:hypothetical protein
VSWRLFILWKNPLFHEAIRLLLAQPEIDIVGDSQDFLSSQSVFEGLKPDTVIIEEIHGKSIISTGVFQIIEAYPWNFRIIRLSLFDNDLWIYHCERWVISNEHDLLNLIKKN